MVFCIPSARHLFTRLSPIPEVLSALPPRRRSRAETSDVYAADGPAAREQAPAAHAGPVGVAPAVAPLPRADPSPPVAARVEEQAQPAPVMRADTSPPVAARAARAEEQEEVEAPTRGASARPGLEPGSRRLHDWCTRSAELWRHDTQVKRLPSLRVTTCRAMAEVVSIVKIRAEVLIAEAVHL